MSINIASFNQPTTFKGLSFILKYFVRTASLLIVAAVYVYVPEVVPVGVQVA
jgi:hypothetical protein